MLPLINLPWVVQAQPGRTGTSLKVATEGPPWVRAIQCPAAKVECHPAPAVTDVVIVAAGDGAVPLVLAGTHQILLKPKATAAITVRFPPLTAVSSHHPSFDRANL